MNELTIKTCEAGTQPAFSIWRGGVCLGVVWLKGGRFWDIDPYARSYLSKQEQEWCLEQAVEMSGVKGEEG